MLPLRTRLPAHAMGRQIAERVRSERVVLVLGATGCGKSTQVPQALLEDLVGRGEPCRLVASQPRRSGLG